MRVSDLPTSRQKSLRLIQELFPEPDALYTKTVSLSDGRQFVEIWDSGWPDGLRRMGGLTQAQARYILARIRDPYNLGVNDRGLEIVLCERLRLCERNTPPVRGEHPRRSDLVRYHAPPLDEGEPRPEPQGSGKAATRKKWTPPAPGEVRTRGRPRKHPVKAEKKEVCTIPWYSDLVGGGNG